MAGNKKLKRAVRRRLVKGGIPFKDKSELDIAVAKAFLEITEYKGLKKEEILAELGILYSENFTLKEQLEKALAENRGYKRMAERDGLTGAYTNLMMRLRLVEEIRYADKEGSPLSVVMFDLDDLKPLQDARDHMWGDNLLREIVSYCDRHTKTSDVVCRYGGDEFLVIMPVDYQIAAAVAERLRQSVEKGEFKDENSTASIIGDVNITISMGVAQYVKGEHPIDDILFSSIEGTVKEFEKNNRMPSNKKSASYKRRVERITEMHGLIKRADMAVYAAKAAGRNCVFVNGLEGNIYKFESLKEDENGHT